MAEQTVYAVISRKHDSNKIIGIFSNLSEAENIFLKYPEGDHFEIEESEIDSLVPEAAQRTDHFYWQYSVAVKLPFRAEIVVSKKLREVAAPQPKTRCLVFDIDQNSKTETWLLCVCCVGSEDEARSIAISKAKEFISLTNSGIDEKEAIAQLNQ